MKIQQNSTTIVILLELHEKQIYPMSMICNSRFSNSVISFNNV